MVWCDLYLRGFFVILTAQMIKSLKKTTSLVLSDISIEWLFPETKEVLLSPVGNTFLFPGDSLISYAVVCDTTRYHSNPKSVSAKTAHYCIHHISVLFLIFFSFFFKGPILYTFVLLLYSNLKYLIIIVNILKTACVIPQLMHPKLKLIIAKNHPPLYKMHLYSTFINNKVDQSAFPPDESLPHTNYEIILSG